MTSQEHTIAVVEPALDGESTIEYAKRTVADGGRATVVVLLTRQTMSAISAFAEAEGITVPDARELYVERLAENYSARLDGGATATIVTDQGNANRVVFETAAQDAATSIVMPQRLVARRGWKSAVAKSQIPVLLAPPQAA